MRAVKIVFLCALLPLPGCAAKLLPPVVAATPTAIARSLPCAEDPPVKFNEAKRGETEDRGNAFDTPETIAQIRHHNAVVVARCSESVK